MLTERERDELQLRLMAEFERNGIKVLERLTLAHLLDDKDEQEAAERAWARRRWDGLL
jgi:hypothetical protein